MGLSGSNKQSSLSSESEPERKDSQIIVADFLLHLWIFYHAWGYFLLHPGISYYACGFFLTPAILLSEERVFLCQLMLREKTDQKFEKLNYRNQI